jgi:hypothetical protein
MRIETVALVLALAACSSGHEAAPQASRVDRHPDSEDFAGGVAWHVVPPLAPHAPSSPMRAAEYVVGDHPDTTLAVFHFGPGEGGSVDDNIHRWVDQFTQPDGRPSRDVAIITHGEAGGLPVTFVDVSGAFRGMRGGETPVAADDQRMLGAIVEGPQGLVFFKLSGPNATVGSVADAFAETIASVHPAG